MVQKQYRLHMYIRDNADYLLYNEIDCLSLKMTPEKAQQLADAFQEQRFETTGKAFNTIVDSRTGKKIESANLR